MLAFISGGLADFSISRSAARARGWGIPVPGDPGQVIYVWWDALGNYLTALGYGTGDANVASWWTGASRRIHVLGKGVVRFHAVYWPAMLASAGLPLPTDILVHDYLTIDGRKISKSGGSTVDPAELAAEFGSDAVRWWLLRDVPRTGDTDFTVDRLVARANDELANGIGNLVNRVVAMVARYRGGLVPSIPAGGPVLSDTVLSDTVLAGTVLAETVDRQLADGDFRRATAAVWAIADRANRFISQARPWRLAEAERLGDRQAGTELDAMLAGLIRLCRELSSQLAPFLPDAAARIALQCAAVDGRLPPPVPVFARLAAS